MRLAFVTGNAHKAEEAAAALKPLGIEVVQQHVPHPEVQADTLEEVARERALWLRGKVRGPYLVEDSGMFIDHLGGFPGVYSNYVFRTLGCEGVLKLLEDASSRAARFESCAAFMDRTYVAPLIVKGICKGGISRSMSGLNGFHFDRIFIPDGATQTFAEMESSFKATISHRARSLTKLGSLISSGGP